MTLFAVPTIQALHQTASLFHLFHLPLNRKLFIRYITFLVQVNKVTKKTLSRLKDEAYWPGMASDVRHYCQSCEMCQKSKLPSPVRVPLVNIPISNPWEMLAVDILEVPVSRNNHRYLLVVMDYFTKLAEAIPLVIRKLLLLQMLLLSYVAVLAYWIFYILIRVGTLRVPYLVKYSKHLAFIKPGQPSTIHRAMEW